jgi:hypothetical protein
MEEDPENGKESSHSAHADGIGIGMKLVRLIKMCLTETYSRVLVRKHLSALFLLGMV